MLSLKPLDAGRGTRSSTVIRISHPQLITEEIFEYQHSMGTTLNESLTKGFEDWAQTDLVALLDALEETPRQCTTMQMTRPAEAEQPERRRRLIFGPVSHLRENNPGPYDPPEEHPFCPCCLFTNSIKAFMPVIESDGFFGVRLFSMRDKDGTASADCRINGEEFEEGKASLRKYVEKWPDRGFEFRKQYVVVQNSPVIDEL